MSAETMWWETLEPYSDEFYQSRGLDPVQQRQEIKELYESKGAELPEGLKKYFPEEPGVKPVGTTEAIDTPVKEAQPKIDVDAPKDADEAVSAVTDVAKTGKKLQTKKLGTGGKIAIGVAIAGLVAHAVTNNNKQEQQSEQTAKNNAGVRASTGNYYDTQINSCDAQIAANISGYGYGKRVGGFM